MVSLPAENRTDSGTATSKDGSAAQGAVAAEVALPRVLAVLRRAPSALITDIDGTISQIVARPDDATVSEAIRSALRLIKDRLALTAVITGRPQELARSMVGVDGLTYVGHYGLDSLAVAGNGVSSGSLAGLKARILAEVKAMEGVSFEEKGLSFSLHYRQAPDSEAARQALLRIAEGAVEKGKARIVEGKQVVELVPAALPDKGDAFGRLADANGIEGVVYCGDDLSDVRVFEELSRRRATGSGEGLSLAVADSETKPEVTRAADLRLAGVAENERLLTLIGSALRDGAEG